MSTSPIHLDAVEGLLAFASGSIRTAFHLRRLNLNGPEQLLDIALQEIQEAGKVELDPKANNWDLLTKLFTIRIIHHLQSPCLSDFEVTKSIYQSILDTLSRAGGPGPKSGLTAEIIKSSWRGSSNVRLEAVEARELAKNLTKRFDSALRL